MTDTDAEATPTTATDALEQRVSDLERQLEELLYVAARHAGRLAPQPGSLARNANRANVRAQLAAAENANKELAAQRAAAAKLARKERDDRITSTLTERGGHLGGAELSEETRSHLLRDHLFTAMPALGTRREEIAWITDNPGTPDEGCCALCCNNGRHLHTRNPKSGPTN